MDHDTDPDRRRPGSERPVAAPFLRRLVASRQAAGLWRGDQRLPAVLRRRHRRRLGGGGAQPRRTGGLRGRGGRKRAGDRAQERRRGGRLARLPHSRAPASAAARPCSLARRRSRVGRVAPALLPVVPGRVAPSLGLRRPSAHLRPHRSSRHDLLGPLVHRASDPQWQYLAGSHRALDREPQPDPCQLGRTADHAGLGTAGLPGGGHYSERHRPGGGPGAVGQAHRPAPPSASVIRSSAGRGPDRRSHLSGSTNPDGPHLGTSTQLEASLERLGVVLARQIGRRLTELRTAVGQDRGALGDSH